MRLGRPSPAARSALARRWAVAVLVASVLLLPANIGPADLVHRFAPLRASGVSIPAGSPAPRVLPTTWGWREVTTAIGPSPTGQGAPKVVWDSTDREAVLFGGTGSNTTWVFRMGSWTELATQPAPPVLYLPGLADDPADGGVLLFGGQSGPYSNSPTANATWLFHAGNWTPVHSKLEPPARQRFAMAYDPTSTEVVLFGGETYISPRTVALDDTWTFAHGNWTNATPARSPPGLEASAMAADPADNGVLLFGGDDTISGYNQTWVFALGTWTEASPTVAPSPRISPAMVFDSSLDELLLFGGIGTPGAFGDTWAYSGGSWTKLPGAGPRADLGSAFFDDPSENCAILTGGYNSQATPAIENRSWAYGHPIVATASTPPAYANISTPIEFDASASGGIPPYKITWSFGDGSNATVASPTPLTHQTNHSYVANGTFHISVHVTDLGGGPFSNWTILVNRTACTSCSPRSGGPPNGSAFDGVPLWVLLVGVVLAAVLAGVLVYRFPRRPAGVDPADGMVEPAPDAEPSDATSGA